MVIAKKPVSKEGKSLVGLPKALKAQITGLIEKALKKSEKGLLTLQKEVQRLKTQGATARKKGLIEKDNLSSTGKVRKSPKKGQRKKKAA